MRTNGSNQKRKRGMNETQGTGFYGKGKKWISSFIKSFQLLLTILVNCCRSFFFHVLRFRAYLDQTRERICAMTKFAIENRQPYLDALALGYNWCRKLIGIQPPNPKLELLPDVPLLIILEYLDMSALVNLSRTSKYFNGLIRRRVVKRPVILQIMYDCHYMNDSNNWSFSLRDVADKTKVLYEEGGMIRQEWPKWDVSVEYPSFEKVMQWVDRVLALVRVVEVDLHNIAYTNLLDISQPLRKHASAELEIVTFYSTQNDNKLMLLPYVGVLLRALPHTTRLFWNEDKRFLCQRLPLKDPMGLVLRKTHILLYSHVNSEQHPEPIRHPSETIRAKCVQQIVSLFVSTKVQYLHHIITFYDQPFDIVNPGKVMLCGVSYDRSTRRLRKTYSLFGDEPLYEFQISAEVENPIYLTVRKKSFSLHSEPRNLRIKWP